MYHLESKKTTGKLEIKNGRVAPTVIRKQPATVAELLTAREARGDESRPRTVGRGRSVMPCPMVEGPVGGARRKPTGPVVSMMLVLGVWGPWVERPYKDNCPI